MVDTGKTKVLERQNTQLLNRSIDINFAVLDPL
jgi:hypothetical protein